jgi:transcriptional regulator with XRE-family HTH domain
MTPSKKANGKKHIGRLIKQARVRMRMRAEDVAEACNVSRSRVYQWEASESLLRKNLKPLSDALNIPLTRLQRENRA